MLGPRAYSGRQHCFQETRPRGGWGPGPTKGGGIPPREEKPQAGDRRDILKEPCDVIRKRVPFSAGLRADGTGNGSQSQRKGSHGKKGVPHHGV